jgi:hypothetical protein
MLQKIVDSKTTRLFLAIITTIALVATMIGLGAGPSQAQAAPAGVNYDSYDVYTRHGSIDWEDTQHVILEFTYPDVVTYPANVNWDSVFSITIAGTAITDPTYYRPLTVTGWGTDTLRLEIAGVEDPNTGDPAFTAQYNGLIVIKTSGLPSIVTVGNSDMANDFGFDTVIPTGVQFTLESLANESSVSAVSVRLGHTADVRGMFHIGVYSLAGSGTLVPVSASPGGVNVYTFTSHAHDFGNLNDADFATMIVTALSAGLPAGWSAAVNASDSTQVDITPPAGLAAYIYIFDDDLIQALNNNPLGAGNYTYDDIVSANGVLPVVPVYN